MINGARPSSKAESLDHGPGADPGEAGGPGRSSAPGDLYGSEYSGKSQVLNVILSADGGFDGNRHRPGAPAVHRPDHPQSVRLGDAQARQSYLQPVARAPTITIRSTKAPTSSPTRSPASGSKSAASSTITAPANPIFRPTGRSSKRPTRRSTSMAASTAAPRISSRPTGSIRPASLERDDRLYLPAEIAGLRDWRRHQPAAGGRHDQVRRHSPTAASARPQDTALNRIDDEVVGGFEQIDQVAAQRDHRPVELDPRQARRFLVRDRRRGRAQHARQPGRPVRRSAPTGSATQIDLPIDDATVQRKARRGFTSRRAARSPTASGSMPGSTMKCRN